MVAAAQHPHIEIVSYAEVEKVSGYIGNFEVTIRKRARCVDEEKCTGCGLCQEKCPSKVDSEFDLGVGKRKAIYTPFPQAVPNIPVIDKENCRKFIKNKCGVCQKLCPTGAVDFEQEDEIITDKFGAIVMATGFTQFKWEEVYGEYGYGKYPDVITGLHFERINNASGPTAGKIIRPSDGQEPKTVVFIKCVGSRDEAKAKSYCSRACCMYTAKHAHQVKEKIADSEAIVFYMDVRTPGKAYDEFYEKTLEDGALYLRGRVSKIYQNGDKLIVKGEDTLIGKPLQVEADLVVLATAMVPATGYEEIAKKVGVSFDKDGWLQESHPKLAPVETHTAGVFVSGACQGPKDIPDTVAQASAAAAKVIGLFVKDELTTSPIISEVDISKCSGCAMCEPVCPYSAITMKIISERVPGGQRERQVSEINPGMCQGCGACTVSCRSGALNLKGFKDDQILAEVDAICQ